VDFIVGLGLALARIIRKVSILAGFYFLSSFSSTTLEPTRLLNKSSSLLFGYSMVSSGTDFVLPHLEESTII